MSLRSRLRPLKIALTLALILSLLQIDIEKIMFM